MLTQAVLFIVGNLAALLAPGVLPAAWGAVLLSAGGLAILWHRSRLPGFCVAGFAVTALALAAHQLWNIRFPSLTELKANPRCLAQLSPRHCGW